MAVWHQLSVQEVLQRLRTSASGLTGIEVKKRLKANGPNRLAEQAQKRVWTILWEQLRSLLVIVLIVAAAASLALGDYVDAAAIMVIVILNALLGARQEYRAEHALAALKKLAAPRVRVRRDGGVTDVPAPDLVPGDIMVLEAGNLVAADARLLESHNLRLQEASLTGESEAVEKSASRTLEGEHPLGDRVNMVYSGTSIAYGRGLGVVTDTGMRTELGRIAHLLRHVTREATPLQQRLHGLARILVAAALVIVAFIFLLGVLRGTDIRLMFLTGVSLAVAAVPEGLPAIVTIALALGAERMLKRNALIRKLPAVETLGSVTVICTDKTGTLTQDRMTATRAEIGGRRLKLEEQAASTEPVSVLLACGALCNDAIPGDGAALGDPTEAALVNAAARLGLNKRDLESALPRVGEVPFSSERRRMTTVHRRPDAVEQSPAILASWWPSEADHGAPDYIAFTKGATDSVLEICTRLWTEDGPVALDEERRRRIRASNDEMAGEGIRVLGFALRPIAEFAEGNHALEQQMIFLGLIGMMDPPRSEAEPALRTAEAAGIHTVMITGDHPLTARHIADRLGMLDGGVMLSGLELDRMSVEELQRGAGPLRVCARASPENKVKIVEAFQRNGDFVAMTGDGVNDAPALKKANIGVAMGITGTDVAREAADMVLQDDNFATIVAAVEEGRIIFDNIRKFVMYLLASNSGELWLMLLAPLLKMPLPLLPLQILWINLITDGLPALALGVEPAERDIMKRPPVPPDENILARGVARDILWLGLLMAAISITVGYWYWQDDRAEWQTMVFGTVTFSQIFLALAVRSRSDSLLQIGILSNKALLGAVILSIPLQLAVVYTPLLQPIFGTFALSPADLTVAVAAGTLPFFALESSKWVRRVQASRLGAAP